MSKNLKFSKEHEWVNLTGNIGTVGISDHAQQELGDITYVELPELGAEFTAGESFATIESVKAASDCYLVAGGKIIEVNESLEDEPEKINIDPYGEGWLIKVEFNNLTELDTLLDEEAYKAFLATE